MRLLIVIAWDEYIRNYGQTGAFRALQREHECLFAFADRCKHRGEFDTGGAPLRTFKIDAHLERAQYDLFNVLTWRHRKRSRTFYYRFSRFYKTYPLNSIKNIVRSMRGLAQAARYVARGNRLVGRFAIPRMIERIPINHDLAQLVDEVAPDMVLVPCSAYDPVGNDIARLGAPRRFRTLFLVDNWDNLSSKSIFWAKPDFVGVWGEQSREHAMQIHGFKREEVSLLGTPRFQSYYDTEKTSVRSHYPFPYILFCGAALAFDELTALHRLDEEVDAHRDVYGNAKIVYRPHPRRQDRLCPDVFREEDFRHVVLDMQIAGAYYRNDSEFQPALDYYPTLLAGARLVVCPLTTMLVESLICKTPVMALAYDDGVHYTSPHNAYKYYLHFEGIDRIVGLRLNRRQETMGDELRALYISPPNLSRKLVDESLEYFLHKDGNSYGDRLAATVNSIAPR